MILHENESYKFIVEEYEENVSTTLINKDNGREYGLMYLGRAPYNHKIEDVIGSYEDTPLINIVRVYEKQSLRSK